MKSADLLEKTYELVTDEGEERSCEAISDEACKETPENFFKNVFNGSLSKLAEQLVSPGTTLPWIFSALGVPASFTGALVPIKDAGSLLPQLMISAKVRAYAVRKWFWVYAAAVQATTLVLMAFVVFNFQSVTAGVLILFLLLIFSLASGVASIAFKDVVGKTIPKGKRGQMLAYRSTLGGLLTLIAGIWLYMDVRGEDDANLYFWLIMTAAILWGLAALVFARIKEESGATEGGKSPINELKDARKYFFEDHNLRNFIFARGLLMAVPLALPFFVMLGKDVIGSEVSNLALIVIAAGIANIISSPFWGRFADKSSKKLMMVVAVLGVINILFMAGIGLWPEGLQNIYFFSVLLLFQVMLHGGARLSRKTYLVDMAPKEERPLYVALANTMIGVFTLIAAGFAALTIIWGYEGMLICYAAFLMIGLMVAGRLREV